MKKIVLAAALVSAQISLTIPKLDSDTGLAYREILQSLPTFNFVEGVYELASKKDALERIHHEQELLSAFLERADLSEKKRTLADNSGLFLYYLEQLLYIIQTSLQTYKTSKTTSPYTFGKEIIDYLAQFKKFAADTFKKSQSAASKDISALAKKAESFLKTDLLKGNIWQISKNAVADDAFANTYAQGLLLFLLNEHFEPDTKTVGQIMTLWNKKPAELSIIQGTTLYQQVASQLDTNSLSDLSASLLKLKASL